MSIDSFIYIYGHRMYLSEYVGYKSQEDLYVALVAWNKTIDQCKK